MPIQQNYKKSINQWLLDYQKGLFHCKDLNSIKEAGWFVWQNEEGLQYEIEKMYEAIKVIAESNKFNNDHLFVTLKEVSVFGLEDKNYSNVIISQELHNLPVIILTPLKENSELFIISNKQKIKGTLEYLKKYLEEYF